MANNQLEGRPQFGASAGAAAGQARGGNILSLVLAAAPLVARAFSGGNRSSQTDTTTNQVRYPLDPRSPLGTQTNFSPIVQERLGMTSPYDAFQRIDEATYNQRIAEGSTRATWLPDFLGNRHY